MAKFIGFYNTDLHKEKNQVMVKGGFSEIYQSDKLCLMSNDKNDNSRRVLFMSKNNIFLIAIGNVLNLSDEAGPNRNPLFNDKCLEKIIDGYMEKGDLFLDQLDGSFAMVIWDENVQCLHLCRDDGGTKLLYYRKFRQGFIFSNDLQVILEISGDKSISKKALVEYLRFLDISPPYTIFEGVYFLEPEKVARVDQGGVSLREKKELILDDAEKNEFSANFEDVFLESVKQRTFLSKNTGVFLSGGIDSSLVCAVASSLRNDIKAVTVGFDDPVFDESQIAKNIAKHLKIDHEVMFFSIDQDFEAFHNFTSCIASPFADPAIIPTFQCFKLLEGGVWNMLDGTGADTLIGMMPARHVHFILNYSRHLPLKLRKIIAGILNCSTLSRNHTDLFDFDDPAEPLIRWDGWKKDEIQELTNLQYSIAHTMFHKLFAKNSHKTPYEIYSSLMGALPDDRINQSSALTGVDVSFPFFDRNVQEWVRRQPMDLRYQKGKSKVLFRDLLSKFVPPEIWNVPKHGFNYQFSNLLQYNNYELVNTFLSRRKIEENGLFEPSIVDSYVKRFKNGDASVKFKVWGLVLFQGWYTNYYEKL